MKETLLTSTCVDCGAAAVIVQEEADRGNGWTLWLWFEHVDQPEWPHRATVVIPAPVVGDTPGSLRDAANRLEGAMGNG